MLESIVYRRLRPGEEMAVSLMMLQVFEDFMAPDYTSDGIRQFCDALNPEAIKARIAEGARFFLVAELSEAIVGAIEIRDFCHVSLLFVDAQYHRKGIARGLISSAVTLCLAENSALRRITLNSSRVAVPIYEKMGFVKTAEEQWCEGRCFTPMILDLIGNAKA